MIHPLERIQVRSLGALASELSRLLETRLWAQVLLAMALGVVAGIALAPETGWLTPRVATAIADWAALPGELFLGAIQMMVVPLVVASVVRGIAASGDPTQLRSTGVGLFLYFASTAVVATVIGILVGLVVQPGALVDAELAANLAPVPQAASTPRATLPEAIAALIPRNPLQAMVAGEMLQVVIFAGVLGAALVSLEPTSSRPLLELAGSVQTVSMRVVSFAMRLAPLAVFGLLARAMLQAGLGVLRSLGAYALAVLLALGLLLVVYVVIVAVVGRRNPFTFLAQIRDPQVLAFSTDSSAATMPVTMRTAVERVGVRPSTSQLVIPLGATVNMDGTACYQGVATLFLAQLYGMDLPLASLVALVATSLGSSIGSPAAPGVGIMILATVLGSVGVPVEGIALIVGVDQVLARFRTVLNVTGDLVACVVIDRWVSAPRTREEELELAGEMGERDVVSR